MSALREHLAEVAESGRVEAPHRFHVRGDKPEHALFVLGALTQELLIAMNRSADSGIHMLGKNREAARGALAALDQLETCQEKTPAVQAGALMATTEGGSTAI